MRAAFNAALLGASLALCGALGADVSLPELPRGQGENCVEPTELMRRNHMDLLFHQRDLTVRSGMRVAKHSLVGCVRCHAGKDSQGRFIPINAPGQFCRSCHAFTGVKLDCFECHAAKPDATAVGGGMLMRNQSQLLACLAPMWLDDWPLPRSKPLP